MNDIHEVLAEWLEPIMWADMDKRERRVSLVIQPRPRWMPQWLWRRLLARMLVMAEGEPDA